jgi:Ca2+ transporting ATPase
MNIPPKVHGEPWTHENGLHYTMIFNTFVFMQVFNQINSRKLGENEFNVFENFFNNSLFIGIMLVTVFVQILLV